MIYTLTNQFFAARIKAIKRSKIGATSCGPGLASG
jgi:hypothetical protein